MKFLKLTSAISLALIPMSAFAGLNAIRASSNQISIQASSTNVNYTETDNGTTVDTEKGNVPGFGLSVSVMQDLWLGNDYFRIAYAHASGHTSYVGQPLNGGGGYGSLTGTSGATLTDYSLRYGKGFVIGNETLVTPYAELGHHEWDRGVNQGETYTNSFYGAGVLGQYSPMEGVVISANALLGTTFGSNIGVAGPSGFSGGLGSSTLYKLGVGGDYAVTKHIHANIGVDYTHFDYGISATYSGYYEPSSKTDYIVSEIGLGYSF